MNSPPPPTRSAGGHLLPNIVLFGRLLRRLGVPVTPSQILDFVAALEHIDLRRKEDVRESGRTVFVSRREHLELFDEAFELFWQARQQGALPQLDLGELLARSERAQEQVRLVSRASRPGDGPAGEDPRVDPVFTYSESEVLRHKNFAAMSDYELAQLGLLMQNLRWDLERRRTRRRQPSRRGDSLDLRRTFRYNVRYGGEPLDLALRRRKWKPRPIVAICDISGSMERYSRVLLQFLYAITNALDRVEAFVFGTRLTRITRHLERYDVDEAVDRAAAAVVDWAGGTRIGDAIRRFNYDWARRLLGGGAIVLLISDGWDRGDPDQLAREMDRLRRSCRRLIWLNPLLGSPGYEPLTRGMQAALPHVDDFLPVHNLVSLEQLAAILMQQHRTPDRREVAPGPEGHERR